MILKKSENQELIANIVSLIENAKLNVVTYANSSLTILFWKIGDTILKQTLENKRADYGKQIVVTLSRELVENFGSNYEEKNLRRMIQFAQEFPDIEKVVTLSRHLSWSHFLVLIPIKQPETREFYAKTAS
ncbi:MAG: DUF1016 N-terminal domain-containing protein [Paludibacteraceae bacterium]